MSTATKYRTYVSKLFVKGCLFALILVTSQVSYSQTCAELFSLNSNTPNPKTALNEIVGQYPDQYGGNILARKAKKAPFFSFANLTTRSNPKFEGVTLYDLVRQYPQFFRKLGFEMQQEILLYPDAEALNARLDRLDGSNSHVRFMSDENMSPATTQLVVKAWGLGKWIYAKPSKRYRENKYHFHDLGVHWSILLIPDDLLVNSINFARILTEARANPNLMSLRGFRRYVKFAELDLTDQLDSVTASIGATAWEGKDYKNFLLQSLRALDFMIYAQAMRKMIADPDYFMKVYSTSSPRLSQQQQSDLQDLLNKYPLNAVSSDQLSRGFDLIFERLGEREAIEFSLVPKPRRQPDFF